MTTLLAFKRLITIQCIFLAVFLSLNASAASNTNVLDEASSAMYEGNWEFAVGLLEKNSGHPINAMAHYLLAVCYSKTRDHVSTLSHAVDALTEVPALGKLYVQSAKDLVRWAGIEIARPSHPDIDIEMGTPDVSLMAKEAEEAKRKAKKIEELKVRVKRYVNVDFEVSIAKLDPCWDESIGCILTDIHQPPDTLLIPKHDDIN